MVRERIRGMSDRTWLAHVLANGPEMILSVLGLVFMPTMFVVSLPATNPHPLDVVPFPLMTFISTFGTIGALAWLYGWHHERLRGLSVAAKWDRFGSLQQALSWAALGFCAFVVPGIETSTSLIGFALTFVWLSRYFATGHLVKRATAMTSVVRRADVLLTETAEQEQVKPREGEQRE